MCPLIGSYGYRILETPLLEATELFLRQSGGGLASRMYSFVDAGSNQVSLRPEFTSPIMRHYLENAGEIELPARWQYAGPVFRYEVAHPEGSGQFTQVGAELLGSGSVLADAELITLAAQLPGHAGLTGCRVELADLDVFHSLLDVAGVSDRARTFIIESVPQLRQGPSALPGVMERAYQLHLGDRNPGESGTKRRHRRFGRFPGAPGNSRLPAMERDLERDRSAPLWAAGPGPGG